MLQSLEVMQLPGPNADFGDSDSEEEDERWVHIAENWGRYLEDTLGHLDVHPSATQNDLCVHVII